MRKIIVLLNIIFFFFILFLNFGCLGNISEKPPIHLNSNMDQQPKYKAFSESDYFSDKRSMRSIIEETIALGTLKNDDFLTGKKDGNYINYFPKNILLTAEFIKKGKKKFEIFCAPCHSSIGDGKGLVSNYLPIKAPSIHNEYSYKLSLGYLYYIITNGVRSMPSYDDQISDLDRWSIVSYIKAIQLSQNYNNIDLLNSIENINKEASF